MSSLRDPLIVGTIILVFIGVAAIYYARKDAGEIKDKLDDIHRSLIQQKPKS